MRAYVSCNCRACRKATSAVKSFHKDLAHRKLRRATKKALHSGAECPVVAYTGYKD